jgi:hypothetical protein
MLHPNQFEVNEAWVAFQLNDAPIQTERDGAFDCLALMDAASCFILGSELLPVESARPIDVEVQRLLQTARSHKQQFPKTLFVAQRLGVADTLIDEAKRYEIDVVSVPENELLILTGEAREAFRQQFGV